MYQTLIRIASTFACQVLTLGIGITTLTCSSIQAQTYSVISENTASFSLPIGRMVRTDTVVQEGSEKINRFTMHRFRRPLASNQGVVLLLPPLGNNFNTYLMHPSGDVERSFAGYLARAGFDVWGYSPRETGIQAGACAGGMDCSPALQWSLDTVVSDVRYIRSRIEAAAPGKVPVIGGFSLGAISALAALNKYPGQYAGLLAWDGSLVSDDLAVRAHNVPFCNQFNALVSAGTAIDDQSLPFVKLVSSLADSAPNAPFALPVPGFPPGLTNRQAFVFILSTPNPFAPSPRPGFITAAGDFASGQLLFSQQDRLAANIADFNDVTANRVSRDMYCSLAGVETKHSTNLNAFNGPVLIVKAGQGFGSIMDELPGKLGSTDVTVIDNNAFGHVDHLGSANHALILEGPVAKWLRHVLP